MPPEVVDGRTAYEDIPGFCKAASLEEIRKHGHVLTPGRYVGAEAAEEDDEPFEDKMARLVAQLRDQQAEAAGLTPPLPPTCGSLGMASEWRERPFGEITLNYDALRVPVKEADRRPGPYPYYGGIRDY